ncbi:hypothetical protein HPB49_014025 [Dermacentor silvarum]|uniref:Uncharacterized protein n=1 Tax=Dermacentor silvarum TaxID=543639 RepID=A0ACB8C423_DERSI|nr:hypothetical protein HPB49_014025 [Dermacentor silvarum]
MDKTFCVLFSHGRGGMERVHPTIRLGGEGKGLKFVESLRILGVVFDRRLSFDKHADHLKEKAEFLSAKAVRAAFRKEQRTQWSHRWEEENADTTLFRWMPRIDELPSFFPPLRPLVTLLTGHGRFPYYFHRFHLMSQPLCPCGSMCESFEHYIYECPLTCALAQTMTPSSALVETNYPVLLRSPRNRAVLLEPNAPVGSGTREGATTGNMTTRAEWTTGRARSRGAGLRKCRDVTRASARTHPTATHHPGRIAAATPRPQPRRRRRLAISQFTRSNAALRGRIAGAEFSREPITARLSASVNSVSRNGTL